jgi:hypothetical protein
MPLFIGFYKLTTAYAHCQLPFANCRLNVIFAAHKIIYYEALTNG